MVHGGTAHKHHVPQSKSRLTMVSQARSLIISIFFEQSKSRYALRAEEYSACVGGARIFEIFQSLDFVCSSISLSGGIIVNKTL